MKGIQNEKMIPEKAIFLDEYGNEVDSGSTIKEFFEDLTKFHLEMQEKTEVTIFIFGDNYSSENDLPFVNHIWKKYENFAGKDLFFEPRKAIFHEVSFFLPIKIFKKNIFLMKFLKIFRGAKIKIPHENQRSTLLP